MSKRGGVGQRAVADDAVDSEGGGRIYFGSQCGDIEFEFCGNAWRKLNRSSLREGCAVEGPVGGGMGKELERIAVVMGEEEVDAVVLIGLFEAFRCIFGNVEGDGVLGFVTASQGCLLALWVGRLQRELYAFALVVVSVYRCGDDNDYDFAYKKSESIGCGEKAFSLLTG